MMGVYKIVNQANEKLYIGSTVYIRDRRARHFKDLRLNIHHNLPLQRAYNKYGFDAFRFELLEEVFSKEDLLKVEQAYIDKLQPEYNICKIAGNSLGVKHRPETNEKNRLRALGFKNPNAKLTEKDFQEIVSKKASHTLAELATIYKVHSSTIERIFKRYGVKPAKFRSQKATERAREHYRNLGALGRKPVNQFDLNGNFIAHFESGAAAAKATGCSAAQISACCRGIAEKTKGYKFTYPKPA